MKSLILFALLAGLGIVLYLEDPVATGVSLAWAAAVASLNFRMERTGRVAVHRTFFFAALALFFLVNMHLEAGTEESVAPYCHLSLAGNVVHLAYNQFLAVVNDSYFKYGALSIGVAWLAIVLANGGAFCSWVCFFGGVDDSLSQILKKPLFRIPWGRRVREFQLALFIFVAFISFSYMEPEFCLWLCPFKIEGEILNQESRTAMFQMAAYAAVGIVFLLALPVVTRQRTFCSAICPFGAVPPLVRTLSPYRVTVDPKRCERCMNCVSECPSFAMEMTRQGAATNRYCTSCQRCVAVCPARAISATLFDRRRSRILPFVSMALGGALAQFYVPGAVLAVIRLTGAL